MLLQTGEPIPDISLPDQDGKPFSLAAGLGANGSIIYFYPRDNTPGCTLEATDFQAALPEFSQHQVTIIGVSKDSVTSHGKFRDKRSLSFTLLSDHEGKLCEHFGVWQEKRNYGKTSMGIVRSTFICDAQGVVQKVYTKVKTKGHVATVLADTKTMLAT